MAILVSSVLMYHCRDVASHGRSSWQSCSARLMIIASMVMFSFIRARGSSVASGLLESSR
eukprot:1612185-Alexandrium_andersonii.AAC.1